MMPLFLFLSITNSSFVFFFWIWEVWEYHISIFTHSKCFSNFLSASLCSKKCCLIPMHLCPSSVSLPYSTVRGEHPIVPLCSNVLSWPPGLPHTAFHGVSPVHSATGWGSGELWGLLNLQSSPPHWFPFDPLPGCRDITEAGCCNLQLFRLHCLLSSPSLSVFLPCSWSSVRCIHF